MNNDQNIPPAEKNKRWFRAKCYGYGWYPATWQAWLTLLVWAIFVGAGTGVFEVRFATSPSMTALAIYVVYILVTIAALTYVSWKKGEAPHWHWGTCDRCDD